MMLSSRYDPAPVEQKWYAAWLKAGLFKAEPDKHKPAYCVLMPPPNITGRLHMGHVLNNTLQDVLVRRKRMQGYATCWVPGIDHASIATEAKVAAQLKTEGKSKQRIGREGFMKAAWRWKEQYGGLILQQLERLGASCDWRRTCFTMDETRSQSVLQTFIHLHEQGYIYRGTRMVHWDPEARTALSDEEVQYKEVDGELYFIAYPLENSQESLTIATTRPETLLGDVALCVHPEDSRYASLQGQKALLPLLGRSLAIIADAYVDPTFGTGCLKITPAHDMNDYLIGEKHQLSPINIMDERGCLNENAQLFVGEDRFSARKQILALLKEKGYLKDSQALRHKVGFSERTEAVVEPRLCPQWFCKMSTLAKPALAAVLEGKIHFFPEHQKNTYRHWIENIKDWCISRQLWWGHRIPVWYTDPEHKNYVLGKTQEEAAAACIAQGISCDPKALAQEKDVLDTWFSSWLWPLSVFDGLLRPQNKDFSYFYPTQDLVTGPDILFFWVARMVMAGYAFAQKPPFRNVYFTGIVRDKKRRKMSKSLGNSPDPMALIEKYGADGVRMGLMICGRAGGDILFDEALCLQGQYFSNKLWNALRLVKSWQPIQKATPTSLEEQAHRCFSAQLQRLIAQSEAHYQTYRLSDAALLLYKFTKEDFCNTYLELLKPSEGTALCAATVEQAITFFEELLALWHPFMPFITEEIWQQLRPRSGAYLMTSPYPKAQAYDAALCQETDQLNLLVQTLRKKLGSQPLRTRKSTKLYIETQHPSFYSHYSLYIQRLTGLSPIIKDFQHLSEKKSYFLVNKDKCLLTGLTHHTKKERTHADLSRKIKLYGEAQKKLSHENFSKHAQEEIKQKEERKRKDSIEIVGLLIEAGADLDAQNNEGQTPLMVAAITNPDTVAIHMLIEAGANLRLKDHEDRDAAYYLLCNPWLSDEEKDKTLRKIEDAIEKSKGP